MPAAHIHSAPELLLQLQDSTSKSFKQDDTWIPPHTRTNQIQALEEREQRETNETILTRHDYNSGRLRSPAPAAHFGRADVTISKVDEQLVYSQSSHHAVSFQFILSIIKLLFCFCFFGIFLFSSRFLVQNRKKRRGVKVLKLITDTGI
jgi:hypothetical protein